MRSSAGTFPREGEAEPGRRERGSERGGVEPPGPAEPWTVLRLLRWSGGYLEDRGVEGGRLEAEHLLAEALDTERLRLYLEFDRPLTPEELDAYRPLLLRRARREPLQHVVGYTRFREVELRTDARAMIPRPETEILVGAVLEWVERREMEEVAGVDVGTGTGAIALSLLREGPFRRIVATDRSEEALSLARENAERLGATDQVAFRRGDLFGALGEAERFDVVVSNPPYVARGDAADLEPEVREWEPEDALFAGPEGTEVVAALVSGAPSHLRPGGLLALEIGAEQGERARELVRGRGAYEEPEIRRDLAGRERILLAVRR